MDVKPEKRKIDDLGSGNSSNGPHSPPFHPKKYFKTENEQLNTTSLQQQNKELQAKVEEQRIEIARVSAETEQLKQNQANCEEILRFMNRSWFQLNQELEDLTKRLDGDNESTYDSMMPYILKASADEDEIRTFISKLVAAGSIEDTLDESWKNRAQEMRSVLFSVVDVLIKQREAIEGIRITLSEENEDNDDNEKKLLRQEIKNIQEEHKKSTKLTDQYHAQVSELSKKLGEASDQLISCQHSISDKDEEINKLKQDLVLLKKQLQEKAMEVCKTNFDTSKSSSSVPSSSSSFSLSSNEVKKEKEKLSKYSADGSTVTCPDCSSKITIDHSNHHHHSDHEEIELLKISLESRQKECDTLKNQSIKLTEEIQSLRMKLAQDANEPVTKSVPFVYLQGRAQQLNASVKEAEKEQLRSEAELAKFKKESQSQLAQTEFRLEQKCKELREITSIKDKQIAQLNRDLEALRSEHNQTKDSTKHLEERDKMSRTLIDQQQAELQKLRAERELKGPFLLKSKEKRLEYSQKSESGGDLSETTQEKDETITKLQQEITEWKEKEQNWIKKEDEMKTLLEVFQSRKDSRDLVEIRASEKQFRTKYEQASKELKDCKKQLETIAQKTEEKFKAQLEKSAQTQKQLTSKANEAKQKMIELEQKAECALLESQEVFTEFEQIAKAYEEVQEQNVRLLSKLQEKDDSNTKLLTDSLKEKRIHISLEGQIQLLTAKNEMIEKTLRNQSDYVKKLEEKKKIDEERIQKIESDLEKSWNQVNEAKRNWREIDPLKSEFEMREKHLKQTFEETLHSQKALTAELHESQSNYHKAQEQVQILQNKLSKVKSNTQGDSSLMEEELKDYKTKVKCPVCNSKQRNTAIMKCGHTFCKNCVQQNLSIRNRKCPSCGKPFAESDVHTIYLG